MASRLPWRKMPAHSAVAHRTHTAHRPTANHTAKMPKTTGASLRPQRPSPLTRPSLHLHHHHITAARKLIANMKESMSSTVLRLTQTGTRVEPIHRVNLAGTAAVGGILSNRYSQSDYSNHTVPPVAAEAMVTRSQIAGLHHTGTTMVPEHAGFITRMSDREPGV